MRAARPKTLKRPAARHRRAPIGCGVDVVELPRLKQAIARGGETFLRRVYTPQERAYAQARRRTQLLHLAGRFAAKEAVIKAMSQLNPRRLLAMNQIEVRNDRFGRPHIVLHGRRAARVEVHISLSHVNSVAVASAIAIRG